MGVVSNPSNPDESSSASHASNARGSSRQIFRFGSFELRAETGELWKHGTRIKLQIKPLQVLETLLERPGELVTRDELCKRLWPAGTFVDFESGLNTATNRLRAALGDSAEAPRYIETLPRLGYRFICPVTQAEDREPVPKATVVHSQRVLMEAGLPAPAKDNRLVKRATIATGLMLALLLVFGYAHFKTSASQRQPTFRQLTFRSGVIGTGRFAPDSEGVIYSAKWGRSDRQTYLLELRGLHSSLLNFAPGALASVSRQGELAFASADGLSLYRAARLSRVSLTGGVPTLIAEGTRAADWAPDGHELALVREDGPESTVEFPAGNVVYVSRGWIDCLRVSPRGNQVAFLEHPVRDDSAGYVRVADKKGRTRSLTDEWNSAEGLAWSPSGDEIWFTASKSGARGVLYAVSETTKLRKVSNTPSSLRLLDISRTGRILVATDDTRLTLMAALVEGQPEKDLSKFDSSHVEDISRNGNLILFTEGGDGGGEHYTAYIHDRESERTYPVASGRGLALSADGKSALTTDPRDRSALTINPIGSGKPIKIFGEGFEYQWAKFLSSSKELIAGGASLGGPLTICRQRVDGGRPVPLDGAPYMDFVVVSPDASRIAGLTGNDGITVFDIASKKIRHVSSSAGGFPVAWSKDGKYLYALTRCDLGYRIWKINMETGKREVWKTITPPDVESFGGLAGIVAAPSSGAYSYSSNFNSSRLYMVDGWS